MTDQPMPDDPDASVDFRIVHAEELKRLAWRRQRVLLQGEDAVQPDKDSEPCGERASDEAVRPGVFGRRHPLGDLQSRHPAGSRRTRFVAARGLPLHRVGRRVHRLLAARVHQASLRQRHDRGDVPPVADAEAGGGAADGGPHRLPPQVQQLPGAVSRSLQRGHVGDWRDLAPQRAAQPVDPAAGVGHSDAVGVAGGVRADQGDRAHQGRVGVGHVPHLGRPARGHRVGRRRMRRGPQPASDRASNSACGTVEGRARVAAEGEGLVRRGRQRRPAAAARPARGAAAVHRRGHSRVRGPGPRHACPPGRWPIPSASVLA